MVTRVTTTQHVVPKKDIDRLFEELVDDASLKIPAKTLQRLRGIAYANTHLADRTIIHEDPPAPPAASSGDRRAARR